MHLFLYSLRLFVIAMTVLGVLIIPIMEGANGGEIYRYATTITGYLGAPTCAMFILAMFWSRASETVLTISQGTNSTHSEILTL